ncbi:MAG: lipid-binding SYLF domain-containing protein [Nitrospiraceae bacterium]|nr:lipid-binding SYLF domain-containing protein [Nitrospiraceae bacterium]
MKDIVIIAFVFSIFFVTLPAVAEADTAGVVKIDDSVEVLQQIMSIPEKGIPPALLSNASGIAIIPGVIKAGFILGGRYGRGILVIREKDGSWSNPVFISVTGGSIGWQVGIESIDIVLVFKSSRSVEGILKGKFTLGADASIAAGPVGRQASASTDILLKSEIYSYSRSRGLFAGLALEGASLQINYDADEAFYGKEHALPSDIVGNKTLSVPPVVDRLKKLLDEYASGSASQPEKAGKLEKSSEQEGTEKSVSPAEPEKSGKTEDQERPLKMEEPKE